MDLREQDKSNHNRHPWELSRTTSLLRLLKDNPRDMVYADIGAGDQFFAHHVVNITDYPVFVIDKGYDKNWENKNIIQSKDLSSLSNGSVDFIFLLDVLEHIKDEDAFLSSVLSKVKVGGSLLITVPACQFLFSSHDVFLKHYRRYNRNCLHDLIKQHNLLIEESFAFYTSLFFLRLAGKYLRKVFNFKTEGVGSWKYERNHLFTKLLAGILNIDFRICQLSQKIGISLPGLSLCIICRKKHY
jgi:SAM-dependent methyltransferase